MINPHYPDISPLYHVVGIVVNILPGKKARITSKSVSHPIYGMITSVITIQNRWSPIFPMVFLWFSYGFCRMPGSLRLAPGGGQRAAETLRWTNLRGAGFGGLGGWETRGTWWNSARNHRDFHGFRAGISMILGWCLDVFEWAGLFEMSNVANEIRDEAIQILDVYAFL